ncbi:hypothetical protein FA15DRAFT_659390 [Coprinopsis marcescibilis]|uniref:Uncharacterized protein n=1 Tax=Coprinopsis marcescibilis TaxID=230819 RepID=A0A5C3KJJ7_COPMA|nr:hypothetical protein FA15DRAFT_659390 [Coprinopsis marcescibilis]
MYTSAAAFRRPHLADGLFPRIPNEIWKVIIDHAATDTRTLLALTYVKPFQPHAHCVLYRNLDLSLENNAKDCDRRISLLYRTLKELPLLGRYVHSITMLRNSMEQDGRLEWSRLREHCSGGYLGELMTNILSREDCFEQDAVLQLPLDAMDITDDDNPETHKLFEPSHRIEDKDMITQWERNVTWHDPDHTEMIHLPGILRLTPNVQRFELRYRTLAGLQPDWNEFQHPLRNTLVEALRGQRLESVNIFGLLNVPSFIFEATPAADVRTCPFASVVQRKTAVTVRSLILGSTRTCAARDSEPERQPIRRLMLGNIASYAQRPMLKMLGHWKIGRIEMSPTSPESFAALKEAFLASQAYLTCLIVDARPCASTVMEDEFWTTLEQGRPNLGCLKELETVKLNFTDWIIDTQDHQVVRIQGNSWWWWAIDALHSALHRPRHGSLSDICLNIDYQDMMNMEYLMTWDNWIWVELQKVLVQHVKGGVKRVRVCLQSGTLTRTAFPKDQKARIVLEVQRRLKPVNGLESIPIFCSTKTLMSLLLETPTEILLAILAEIYSVLTRSLLPDVTHLRLRKTFTSNARRLNEPFLDLLAKYTSSREQRHKLTHLSLVRVWVVDEFLRCFPDLEYLSIDGVTISRSQLSSGMRVLASSEAVIKTLVVSGEANLLDFSRATLSIIHSIHWKSRYISNLHNVLSRVGSSLVILKFPELAPKDISWMLNTLRHFLPVELRDLVPAWPADRYPWFFEMNGLRVTVGR